MVDIPPELRLVVIILSAFIVPTANVAVLFVTASVPVGFVVPIPTSPLDVMRTVSSGSNPDAPPVVIVFTTRSA